MPRLVWIFIALLTVWQIIARVAEQAAQKQRQRKLNEAATLGRPREHPTPTPPPAAAPLPDKRRLDDLAARRRAQIEELRRRRELRVATPGSTPPRPQPLPTAPRPMTSVARPAPPVHQPRPTSSPARPAPPTSRPRSSPPARPAPATRPPPEFTPVTVVRQARPPQAVERDEAPPHDELEEVLHEATQPQRPVRAGGLTVMGSKLDRSLLRKVIVLNEILGPPVSLRDAAVRHW